MCVLAGGRRALAGGKKSHLFGGIWGSVEQTRAGECITVQVDNSERGARLSKTQPPFREERNFSAKVKLCDAFLPAPIWREKIESASEGETPLSPLSRVDHTTEKSLSSSFQTAGPASNIFGGRRPA